jgi:hypothetical protein
MIQSTSDQVVQDSSSVNQFILAVNVDTAQEQGLRWGAISNKIETSSYEQLDERADVHVAEYIAVAVAVVQLHVALVQDVGILLVVQEHTVGAGHVSSEHFAVDAYLAPVHVFQSAGGCYYVVQVLQSQH